VLHCAAVQVLQRPDWNGAPVELAELFHLAKGNNRRVRCLILSHKFGFELRLVFGSRPELLRSQVCRTDDEVLTTGEEWKASMIEEGWR
jgi:hypothetical protein